VLTDVQWTGSGEEQFATVTITANELADAMLSQLIWTDQSVQRGIQPTAPVDTPRELPVAAGYPDPSLYIFDRDKADEIAEKILYRDARLFLNPLVWNLRPGTFNAFDNEADQELWLYDGKIYLPDSHHRHQAILKAVLAARDAPNSYKRFSLDQQYKVELYFLDREDEGNYFFDKNQRPRPVALSKAYDLTTQDALSVLAKRVIERSPNLSAGTNRVTDRLSRRAPHFITLSTLREMMRTFASAEEVDESEIDGMAIIAASFFDLLSEVRPELNASAPDSPHDTLAAAGVMMQGFAVVMRDFGLAVAERGLKPAEKEWAAKLARFAPAVVAKFGSWSGDFFANENPLWQKTGIVVMRPTGRLTVTNTGGARTRAGRVLQAYLAQTSPKLSALVNA
jgi:hypothetical protein